jgi:hypothetical protein
MLAKPLKYTIVLAVVFMFLGGSAMADGRGHDGHQPGSSNGAHQHAPGNGWHHQYAEHHQGYYAYHRPQRPIYHQGLQHIVVAKANPLAPRILFLGPIPVPVPPPPNVVLDYLTGRR